MRYYGTTDKYSPCPIKGSCIHAGYQCRGYRRCTWLEYEVKVKRWSYGDS